MKRSKVVEITIIVLLILITIISLNHFYVSKVEKLENEIYFLKNDRALIEDRLLKESNKIRSENVSLKETIESLIIEKETETRILKDEIEVSKFFNSRLEETVMELKQENAILFKDLKNEQKINSDSEVKIKTILEIVSELETKLEKLNSDYQKELCIFSDEKEDLVKALEQANESNDVYEKKLNEVVSKNSDLLNKVTSMQDDRSQLKEEVESLTAAKSNLAEELQNTKLGYQEKLSNLFKKLETKEQEVSLLKETNESLIIEKETGHQRLTEEIELSLLHNSKLEEDVETLKEKNTELIKKLTESEKSFVTLKEKFEDLLITENECLENHKKAVQSYEAQIVSLEKEKLNAIENLETKQTEIIALQTENRSVEEDFFRLQQRLNEELEESQKLSDDLISKESEIIRLEENLENQSEINTQILTKLKKEKVIRKAIEKDNHFLKTKVQKLIEEAKTLVKKGDNVWNLFIQKHGFFPSWNKMIEIAKRDDLYYQVQKDQLFILIYPDQKVNLSLKN